MKFLITIILLSVLYSSNYAASIQWDGGGDGVSWTDDNNWVGDMEPTSADFAVFPSTVGTLTVVKGTGTPNTVKGLFVNNNVDLTLDLDLNLSHIGGSGSVRLFNSSVITIKTGRTLTISSTNSGGFGIEYRNINGDFNVEVGAMLSISGVTGVGSNSNTNTGCTFDNFGVINFTTTGASIRPNASTDLIVTNHACALMDLGNDISDGSRVKLFTTNASSFINNGLVTYGGNGTGISIITPSIATNNAFFNYTSGSAFSTGTGTSIDNGVDVSSTVALDAANTCFIDINGINTGMTQYSWQGMSVFDNPQNATSGSLDLTGGGFSNTTGPHTITITDANCITTGYSSEFTVTVANVCAAALPVDLTYFAGFQKDAFNVLEWETASEENNSHFEIEHSEDGVKFNKIGIVEGNGTILTTSYYEFIDKTPTSIAYYRLRQVDFDGQFEYSPIISIQNQQQNKEITIYPNPIQNELNIKYSSTLQEEITISIIDVTGRVLLSQLTTTQVGNNILKMECNTLSSGTYFIKIKSPSHHLTKSFIK